MEDVDEARCHHVGREAETAIDGRGSFRSFSRGGKPKEPRNTTRRVFPIRIGEGVRRVQLKKRSKVDGWRSSLWRCAHMAHVRSLHRNPVRVNGSPFIGPLISTFRAPGVRTVSTHASPFVYK
jgi:hypothetical protein